MYYFIVNEFGRSGQSRELWKTLKEHLYEKEIEHKSYLTEKPKDATRFAQKISAQDIDDIRIVVVGGDGTVNEVLNGINDFSKVSLGVVPLGSANDFANGLGLPIDPKGSIENILNCNEPKTIDLGKVTFDDGSTKYFGISAGIGLDAEVTRTVNKSLIKKGLNAIGYGSKAYAIHTGISFITMKQIPVKVCFDDEETLEFKKMIFLSAMNTSAEGGGIKMAPSAKFDDGLLTFCSGHDRNKLQAPMSMLHLLNQTHEDREEFTIRNFKKLEVWCESPLALHTDGEYGGDVTHVTIECLEGTLRLLL